MYATHASFQMPIEFKNTDVICFNWKFNQFEHNF